MVNRDNNYYLAKFTASFDISSSGCWVWKRGRNTKGYGRFSAYGNKYMAHRWIWSYHNGDIPSNFVVMHKCDNPPCVNPDHLILGTHKDNMLDRNSKGRQAKGLRSGVHTKPHTRCYGSKSPRAKLTWGVVDNIRALSAKHTTRYLASKFGLSPGQISKIVNFVQWKEEGRHAK